MPFSKTHPLGRGVFNKTPSQIYGSEIWPMKVDDMQRLESTKRLMVRWMCSVGLKDRIPSKELNSYLGVLSVTDVVRHCRLR